MTLIWKRMFLPLKGNFSLMWKGHKDWSCAMKMEDDGNPWGGKAVNSENVPSYWSRQQNSRDRKVKIAQCSKVRLHLDAKFFFLSTAKSCASLENTRFILVVINLKCICFTFTTYYLQTLWWFYGRGNWQLYSQCIMT